MGRTEADREITNEPWSSMQRSTKTNKTTPGSERRSLFKSSKKDLIRSGIAIRPVVLATDNAALENRLRELFPSLISFPKSYTPAAFRTTPIEIALSEMLLLGQCEKIVGTYYSSSSKFSAIWGGVTYFEVIGRECVRSDFVDRMIQR